MTGGDVEAPTLIRSHGRADPAGVGIDNFGSLVLPTPEVAARRRAGARAQADQIGPTTGGDARPERRLQLQVCHSS